MPLDLSYWLDEDDIDVAFAAHGFKERNSHSKIFTHHDLGEVCISQPISANNALLALQGGESDVGKFIAKGPYPKTVFIPIISGSHVTMMHFTLKDEVVKSSLDSDVDEEKSIECRVTFYDPHGLEEKKYPDHLKRSKLLAALKENLVGYGIDLRNITKTHPPQQKNEGQCGDFVIYYLSQVLKGENPYIEEASEEVDLAKRQETLVLIDEKADAEDKRKFRLATTTMSDIDEGDRVEAFFIKIKKVQDSILVQETYGFDDFNQELCHILKTYKKFSDLQTRQDELKEDEDSLITNALEVFVIDLLIDGQGGEGIIGGISPFVGMFQFGDDENIEVAYERLKMAVSSKYPVIWEGVKSSESETESLESESDEVKTPPSIDIKKPKGLEDGWSSDSGDEGLGKIEGIKRRYKNLYGGRDSGNSFYIASSDSRKETAVGKASRGKKAEIDEDAAKGGQGDHVILYNFLIYVIAALKDENIKTMLDDFYKIIEAMIPDDENLKELKEMKESLSKKIAQDRVDRKSATAAIRKAKVLDSHLDHVKEALKEVNKQHIQSAIEIIIDRFVEIFNAYPGESHPLARQEGAPKVEGKASEQEATNRLIDYDEFLGYKGVIDADYLSKSESGTSRGRTLSTFFPVGSKYRVERPNDPAAKALIKKLKETDHGIDSALNQVSECMFAMFDYPRTGKVGQDDPAILYNFIPRLVTMTFSIFKNIRDELTPRQKEKIYDGFLDKILEKQFWKNHVVDDAGNKMTKDFLKAEINKVATLDFAKNDFRMKKLEKKVVIAKPEIAITPTKAADDEEVDSPAAIKHSRTAPAAVKTAKAKFDKEVKPGLSPEVKIAHAATDPVKSNLAGRGRGKAKPRSMLVPIEEEHKKSAGRGAGE